MAPFDTTEQQTVELTAEAPCAPELLKPPPPRGRPWVKGQSGNPLGRPSRAFQANYLAQGLIAKNTVMLTRKLIELAAGGDRAALKMCLDRVAPARRDPPVLFPTPAVETRRDVVSMLKAVANAVAMGDITPAQAATMIQMLDRVYCQL